VPAVPVSRIRVVHAADPDPARDYVLYWMIAARRAAWNPALDRAVEHGAALRKPVLVFEPLRVDYPWASERIHAFVLGGMKDNAAAFARAGVGYYPYVEPERGAGRGLLEALASRACVVVTDDFPGFFLPRMVAAAARRIAVLFECVDGNGLLPLSAAGKAYPSAAHFRRVVQRRLAGTLVEAPAADALRAISLPAMPPLPRELDRWRPADADVLSGRTLDRLPLDHDVRRADMTGGHSSARTALDTFVDRHLDRYHEQQRHPDANGTSRLSPYLHFGHISAHEVFEAVARHEHWTVRMLSKSATGAREGWWQMGQGAEAYLDQLVVWRELAFNTAAYMPDYDSYDSLPAWARHTLEAHVDDEREQTYDQETLEAAKTSDPIWNAAQRQLLEEGWCHNYLRMLWGKKILEWSPTPREALRTMADIMNRWSLDGRDPNSYAGYAWTLGRYDRPWPERPIFGKVRAMSSASTARKVRLRHYLERYGEHS
jgi:deoxyribodipyrimidine photo-lyase